MAIPSQQPGMIALCTILLSFSTIAVILRLWAVRTLPNRKFGWDDAFAVATLPFIWAENALIFWWISLGLGLHANNVPPSDLAQAPKVIFAAALLYDVAITFPKFSALFFYHRVFETTYPWFYRALWLAGSLNAAWLIAALFSTIFQCSPVAKAWDQSIGGYCFPQWAWFLGTAASSTIIDLIILVMPLPTLWTLRMTNKRKALVTALFICGYSVIVVSIGRLVAVSKAGAALEDDITWDTISYTEWVQCEGPISLISVCLPTIFHWLRSTRKSGNGCSGTGHASHVSSSRNKTYVPFARKNSFKLGAVNTDDMELAIYQYGNEARSKATAWGGARRKSSDRQTSANSTPMSLSRENRIYIQSEVQVETV